MQRSQLPSPYQEAPGPVAGASSFAALTEEILPGGQAPGAWGARNISRPLGGHVQPHPERQVITDSILAFVNQLAGLTLRGRVNRGLYRVERVDSGGYNREGLS